MKMSQIAAAETSFRVFIMAIININFIINYNHEQINITAVHYRCTVK